MISGSPGAQDVCSTRRFCLSQVAGLMVTHLPLSFRGVGIAGRMLLTASAGHSSRVGMNMNRDVDGTA